MYVNALYMPARKVPFDLKIVNMAAVVESLTFIHLLLNNCYCSSTTELLETVMRLLNGCARFYPHADLNMADNLIVRFEVGLCPTFS